MKAKLLFLLIAIADIVAVVMSIVRCLQVSSAFNISVMLVFAFSVIILAEIGETKFLSHQALVEPNLDEEALIPPYGLGGYVLDVPVDRSIGGYTTRQAAEALTLMAMAGKITPGGDEQFPAIYDEPMAMYPMEME